MMLQKGAVVSPSIILPFLEGGSLQSGKGCIPTLLDPPGGLCIPFLLSDRSSTSKSSIGSSYLLMITPAWQSQSWYPKLLQLSIQNPILLLQCKDLLTNPEGKQHPLAIDQKLQLVVWTVSRKQTLVKSYQKALPNLSLRPEEEVQKLITSWCSGSQVDLF